MRRGQWDIAEKGAGFLDEVDSAFGDPGHDFFHQETRGDGAAAIVGASFDLAVVGNFIGRLGDGTFAIEVEVGWHVEGGGDTEVFVEAEVEGAGG